MMVENKRGMNLKAPIPIVSKYIETINRNRNRYETHHENWWWRDVVLFSIFIHSEEKTHISTFKIVSVWSLLQSTPTPNHQLLYDNIKEVTY